MQHNDYFQYNNGNAVTKGAFRISASQLSKFFDTTSQWYHENLLHEEGFTGNTSSELGTIVHAGIEMFVKEGIIHWQQLDDYALSITNPDVDIDHIRLQYQPMLEAVIPFVQANRPAEVEKFVFHEVLPNIVAGGSIDALKGQAVIDSNGEVTYPYGVDIMDWKTSSALSPPTSFSRNYWFQQMCYAWVLYQKGIKVNFIKLVYITQSQLGRTSEKTGKPLKDYPSQISVVTEEVTQDKLALIGSCIQIVAESVKAFHEMPEIRHLLAQDSRLKVKAKPILFKKV
jgi:hypothetical protein